LDDKYFSSLNRHHVSAMVALSKSLLKAIIHMQHQVQDSITLTIYIISVRRMEECFTKSTNFGQSQWLIEDLPAQQCE
jgi:hypothetical protein